jgi:hypothetical protein
MFMMDIYTIGLSSLLSDILLCLLTSPVQTQLMLTVFHWGAWAPAPNMASLPLGSAHTPFLGSRTLTAAFT